MQSFEIIKQVRKKINQKKVGYLGTLDNFASGLMLVAVGKATKLIPYLLNLPKTYRAKVEFGVTTDTLDINGNILEKQEYFVDRSVLEKTLKSFEGSIMQKPPEFSSKKIKGQRASDLKRQGRDVELPAVPVKIYKTKILSSDPHFAEILVSCSTGTYIRSLARDWAAKMGTIAYLHTLERLENGKFSLQNSLTIEEISESNLISMREALYLYEELTILPKSVPKLETGKELFLEDFYKINLKKGIFKVILDEILVAIVEYNDNRFKYLNNFYEP